MSKRILIVGADGLIGSALEAHFSAAGFSPICTNSTGSNGRRRLDLSSDQSAWDIPDDITVAYLLAGKTAVAECERAPDTTRLINVTNTLTLADRLGKAGAHIVYLSTNLVFSGNTANESVDAPLAPQCRYAAQKVEVETAFDKAAYGTSVLRITKIVEGLEGIVQQWTAALREGQAITPFSDLVAAPMPLASVIKALDQLGKKRLDGLFHIGADRDFSYAEIAVCLAGFLGVPADLVQPVISTAAGIHLQACPKHTTLHTAATESALDLQPISTEATLAQFFERIVRDID